MDKTPNKWGKTNKYARNKTRRKKAGKMKEERKSQIGKNFKQTLKK